MEILKDILKNHEKKFTIMKREPSSLEELGIELSIHFPKNKGQVWKVIRDPTYKQGVIKEAWIAYQKGKIKTFPYFLGILKRKRK